MRKKDVEAQLADAQQTLRSITWRLANLLNIVEEGQPFDRPATASNLLEEYSLQNELQIRNLNNSLTNARKENDRLRAIIRDLIVSNPDPAEEQ